MSPTLTFTLAASLAIAPADTPGLDLEAEGLDAAALEAGLRVRVGDELDRWSISVEREEADTYRIALQRADTRPVLRKVVIEGSSDEDRSRELAATLAVILDEAASNPSSDSAPEREPSTAEPEPLEQAIGFVVLEGHVALGPPRDPDPAFGFNLGAGAWLLRDHLQPRVRVGWSHSWAGSLEVHQVHAGLGLAGGAAVDRFWFGVLVLPAFKWTYARQITSSTAWLGGGEVSVIAQYRRRHFLIGFRTGIETTWPAPRVPGTHEVIRWGHLRWLGVLELGFGLGKS